MSIPIITCGDSQADATKVHAGLRPEFEVIYAGFSLPETLNELPLILSGKPPATSSLHTQIAANEFKRRPVAIVFGGGYDDAAFERVRDASIAAVGGDKTALGVAFFRADRALTVKLHAEGKGPERKNPEYGRAIAQRLKAKLLEVNLAEGVTDEQSGELFWF